MTTATLNPRMFGFAAPTLATAYVQGSKCKDAKWPANQGGMCAHGLVCVRVSQWYRGCDVPGKASG